MTVKYIYRDTNITGIRLLSISSDIFTTVLKTINVNVASLPAGTVKVRAVQSGGIVINAPVKWFGGETTSITNSECSLTTQVQVNAANLPRSQMNLISLDVIALDADDNVLATSTYVLRVLAYYYKEMTETASIQNGMVRLPYTATCNTFSVTPVVEDIYPTSITYEILSNGNIEDITSEYNINTTTATIYSCPTFYSNRYSAKYQGQEEYVNFELVVRFYAISKKTGKEVTGDLVYYMPVNYVYHQDIAINNPVKINYDNESISITPSFTTDYVFKSVSVVKTGAVTKAAKYENAVTVTTKEAATDTRSVLRFNFTSEVMEPYNFYYDIDVIKQGTPDFTVFNSNVNYTEQFTDETNWSAHIGNSSDSIAAGKLVPINGAARLMLGNICTVPYPVINIAPVMSNDTAHSIIWENIPVAQSNTEYRVETEKGTLWYAPRWAANPGDSIYIELSSDKLYRNTPFYISYNIGRDNKVDYISLIIYVINNGVKKAIWVKNNMSFDYGVTHVAYNYYGIGDKLSFEWTVNATDGTSYSITEIADLDDTCHHPYFVYWTGEAGCVKQIALNDTTKKKVSTSYETMKTPYYADNMTRNIKKRWKTETTAQLAGATDYLNETEMSELASLFKSLSVYMYDVKKQNMTPVVVTDKSFTISTFANNGHKYASASFNIDYAESQTVFG